MTVAQRIAQKTIPEPNTGCWLWMGMTNGRYPLIKVSKRNVYVHRYVCEQTHGLPEGQQALHKCDVPLCVNPDHLYPGTQKQNMQDCIARGRISRVGARTPQRGADRPRAKLTDQQAVEIKISEEKGTVLSAKYGVSRAIISQIKSGKRWRHV
jgi:hypothetical protein